MLNHQSVYTLNECINIHFVSLASAKISKCRSNVIISFQDFWHSHGLKKYLLHFSKRTSKKAALNHEIHMYTYTKRQHIFDVIFIWFPFMPFTRHWFFKEVFWWFDSEFKIIFFFKKKKQGKIDYLKIFNAA